MAEYVRKPAPRKPADFDPEKKYTADDLRAVVDYYNYRLTLDKLNYIQFDDRPDIGYARVYVTGKYEFGAAYGIKRYQFNLCSYEGEGYVEARDSRNYARYKTILRYLLSEDAEKDIVRLLEKAERDPQEMQALSFDRPPQGEPHTDWKYRYHYPPKSWKNLTASPTAPTEPTD